MSTYRSLAVFAAIALVTAVPAGVRACEGSVEEVVAFSTAHDEYVSSLGPARSAVGPNGFVIRRLSTGEPIDYVMCAGSGACELGGALGLRACSLTRVTPKVAV